MAKGNPFESEDTVELHWGTPRESIFDALPDVLPDWLPNQETINKRLLDFLPGVQIRQRQEAAGVPRSDQLNSLTYHTLNMPGYITGLAVNAPYLPRMAEQGLQNLFRSAQLYEPGRQGRMDEQFAERVLDANIYGQAASPFARAPAGALRSGLARIGDNMPPYERKLDESGHFSQLVESLSKEDPKRPKSGTPQQWRNYLQKQGVKKEEMRWTGMDKWLDGQDPKEKIALMDLATEAEKRRVNLERGVNKGTFDEEYWRDRQYEDYYDRYEVRPSEHWKESYKETMEVRKHVDEDGNETYRVYDVDNDDPDDFLSEYSTFREAEDGIIDMTEEAANDFGEWAIFDRELDEELDGGFSSQENAQEGISYRIQDEMDYESPQEYARRQGEAGTTTSQHLDDRPSSPFEDDYTEMFLGVNRNVLEQGGVNKSWTGTHIESPFGQNETGWTLSDVYYDAATGQRGTLAHEVQSDWAQRGRERGWATATPEEIQRLNDQKEALWAEYKALPETAEYDGKFYSGLRPGDVAAIERLDTRRNVLLDQAERGDPRPEVVERNRAGTEQLQREINDILGQDGVAAISPETAAQMRQAKSAAELRFNEADGAYKAATAGAPEGPFVTDKSGPWRQAIGADLYRAAQDGQDWYAVANAADRWGQHLDEFYRKIIPNTLKKLARQHDPKAELETFYPTDRKESRELFTYEAPNPEDQGQMSLPGLSGYGEQLTAPTRFQTQSPIGDVVMRPSNSQGYPVGMGHLSEAEPRYYITPPGHGHANAIGHGFRTREGAETVANELRRKQETGDRPPFDPSGWDEEGTHRGTGIRLTPEMRESILKKGFPLFSRGNEAMPFVMGQWQASPEEPFRESEPLTWELP